MEVANYLRMITNRINEKSASLKEWPVINHHLERRALMLAMQENLQSPFGLMAILAHCCNEIILLRQFYKSKLLFHPKRLKLGKSKKGRSRFIMVKRSHKKLKKAESLKNKYRDLRHLKEYVDLLLMEADALLFQAVLLPVVPVASISEFKAVCVMKEVHNFMGLMRLSPDIPKRLRKKITELALSLDIVLAPERDGGSTCSTSRYN